MRQQAVQGTLAEFAKQINLHLDVMKQIGENVKAQTEATRHFTEAVKLRMIQPVTAISLAQGLRTTCAAARRHWCHSPRKFHLSFQFTCPRDSNI